jgi:peroxiredoxin
MRAPQLILATVLAAAIGATTGVGGYLLYERGQQQAGAVTRPAFQLPDLADQPQAVSQWDGKVVVLNFWGSWCPPCVHEIPILIDLQREYGKQGLQVVGVAVDRRDAAQAFAEETGINYPLLYGVQSALEVAQAYGNNTGTLPYTAVIDRDGIIRHVFPREFDRVSLEAALRPLL